MKTYVLGNWKCNGDAAMVRTFADLFKSYDPTAPEGFHRGLALPFHLLNDATFHHAMTGAENVSPFGEGAYTGEISAGMIKSTAAEFCLVGHSERRQYFGEDVGMTAKKLNNLLAAEILPVFCIGETLEQREAGELEKVLSDQLSPIADLSKDAEIVVAYEPVWAIGTGVAATPDDVINAHAGIKKMLADMGQADTAVLYGGSVKPANAEALGAIKDVDGFLIGGASLKTEDFKAILEGFLAAKA